MKHISTADQYGLTGEIKEKRGRFPAPYYPRLENTAMDTVIEEKVMGMVNAAKEGVDASKQGDAPQAELSMDFRSIQAGTNGNLCQPAALLAGCAKPEKSGLPILPLA